MQGGQRRIADRYVIEEQLGEGGMGVVLRAFDERLGRAVAVKVLHPAAVRDGIARERLVREARAAAALEHPGIVHVYDVGVTDDGGAFLVMELVRGKSLRELLESSTLSLRDRLRVVIEAARALGFAHKQGFVHRDIKPDNIMVRDDGRAVVLDFGLAKAFDAGSGSSPDAVARIATLTQAGTFVGTPAYLAPEQAQGAPMTAAVDQFALAVVAYEVLTGQLPWPGASVMEVIAGMLRDEPQPPSSVTPVLPTALDAVLAHALAKKPADRFVTMDAFADALAALGPLDGTAESIPRVRIDPGAVPFATTVASNDTPPDAVGGAVRSTQSGPSTRRSVDSSRPAALGISAAQGPIRSARSARARTLGLAVAILAITGGALVFGGSRFGHRTTRSVVARSSAAVALDLPTTTVACPPLHASGVAAPGGWFGAAAATLACSRVQTILGGDERRTLVPAELLGFAREPADDAPSDPYGPADGRDRALVAARERATAYLDGSVELRPSDIRVELFLKSSQGDRELARGEGAGKLLFHAVRAAVASLNRDRALPTPHEPIALLEHVLGAKTVDGALQLQDLTAASLMEDSLALAEECDHAKARVDFVPATLDMIRRTCAWRLRRAAPTEPLPPIDRSSPGALATTLTAHHFVDPPAAVRAELPALRKMYEQETSLQVQAVLAETLAEIHYDLGENIPARDFARRAVRASPKSTDFRGTAWHRLAFTSDQTTTTVASHAAWLPWEPMAQANLEPKGAAAHPQESHENVSRRAYILSPRGYWAQNYGEILLRSGKVEDARGVAVQSNSRLLPIMILEREARFAQALAAVTTTLDALPATEEASAEAVRIALEGVDASLVLERPATFIDAFVARYVDPEPPRFARNGVIPFFALITTCAQAPRPVARRCLGRVRTLFAGGYFGAVFLGAESALVGAEKYVAGDFEGAARAWRPMVRSSGSRVMTRNIVPMALDRVGEPENAEKADEDALVDFEHQFGASLAHVRAARRAEMRGDHARARKLAQAVVEAWALADDKVPAVAEMKAILARP